MFYRHIGMQTGKQIRLLERVNQRPNKNVYKLIFEYVTYTVINDSSFSLFLLRLTYSVYIIAQQDDFLFYTFINNHCGYIFSRLTGFICCLFVNHDRQIYYTAVCYSTRINLNQSKIRTVEKSWYIQTSGAFLMNHKP